MNSKVASEERIDLGRYDERFYAIVGRGDENVRFFSKVFDVRIVPRGTELIVKGEDDKVRKFASFLKAVMLRLERERLTAKEVRDYAKDQRDMRKYRRKRRR